MAVAGLDLVRVAATARLHTLAVAWVQMVLLLVYMEGRWLRYSMCLICPRGHQMTGPGR